MTAKIYVSQFKDVSFSDAQRFGDDLIFLTDKEIRPTNPIEKNNKIAAEIRQNFSKFDPKKDYVILNGSPISIGYVFHLAMEHSETFRILKWANEQKKYDVMVFDPFDLKLL